jgi:hypothetical protein
MVAAMVCVMRVARWLAAGVISCGHGCGHGGTP